MSEWATPELKNRTYDYRTQVLKQIGTVLVRDKKGRIINFQFRYKVKKNE